MTNTIELKTITTADEPDRTKRFTSPILKCITAFAGGSDLDKALQYREDRGGWTWGTCSAGFSWDTIVDSHPNWFPLESIERKAKLVSGRTCEKFQFTDCGGDKLEVRTDLHNFILTTEGQGGRSGPGIVLNPSDMLKFKDYLERVLTIDES